MGHGFLNHMCTYENITCILFKPCEYPTKKVCCGCSVLVENVCYEFWDKSWGFVTDVSFLVITC